MRWGFEMRGILSLKGKDLSRADLREAHLLEPLEVARDIVHTVARGTEAFQPEFTVRRRWVP